MIPNITLIMWCTRTTETREIIEITEITGKSIMESKETTGSTKITGTGMSKGIIETMQMATGIIMLTSTKEITGTGTTDTTSARVEGVRRIQSQINQMLPGGNGVLFQDQRSLNSLGPMTFGDKPINSAISGVLSSFLLTVMFLQTSL